MKCRRLVGYRLRNKRAETQDRAYVTSGPFGIGWRWDDGKSEPIPFNGIISVLVAMWHEPFLNEGPWWTRHLRIVRVYRVRRKKVSK